MNSGNILKAADYYQNGWVKTEIDANGSVTEYFYFSNGKLKEKIIKDINQKELYKESYDYDEANQGQFVKVTKTIYQDPQIVTNTYFDRAGKVIKLEQVNDEDLYTDTFKYDYLGNKIEEKNARANNEGWNQEYTTKWDYNHNDKVKKTYNANQNTSMSDYDRLGMLISKTDFNKSAASFRYDKINRLIEEKVPFDTVNGQIIYQVKKYFYDNNGNIRSLKTSCSKPEEKNLEFLPSCQNNHTHTL
jgi:YD repeat-containing protein